jgi:hypothetical protein
MQIFKKTMLLALLAMAVTICPRAEETFRLYQGVTLYIDNARAKDFEVKLDIRDLNLFSKGAREVMCKLYDPNGKLVVREFIADDGVTEPLFPGRISSWDHELQYNANLYAKGTVPTIRTTGYCDPARLKSITARTFNYKVTKAVKGVYRLVLVGSRDNLATVNLTPALPYGTAGHPTFLYRHHKEKDTSYAYVPQGSDGMFMILVEPDMPRQRKVSIYYKRKLLYSCEAKGGYTLAGGDDWKALQKEFAAGKFDRKVLRIEVSEGKGDYLLKLAFTQPKKDAFKDYVGMGSQAVLAPDAKLAKRLAGGTHIFDKQVYWHPFQSKFAAWLKANPLNKNDKEKALRKDLDSLFNYFRLMETSDGRGSKSWTNWAYAFGYYGCRIWRTSWKLMPRKDVPQEIKDIIREGLIMAADRLSFATGMEPVNGNAFSQINVALWYAAQATKDPQVIRRFELFWKRWAEGDGWGNGFGLSRSGDSQEHFAHDMHYGSYIMDNWLGVTWVKEGGILDDAKGIDDRFQKVMDRYRELYSYLFCRETKGRAVGANPWSSRTHMTASGSAAHWEKYGHKWKGEPGKDFTVSVNDGDEWFAARRPTYYALTFHGRLAPEWMSRCFEGQLGFSGGTLCQLTVPGKGPVLTGTIKGSYGKGCDPANWRNLHINSIVGERWDGAPLVSAISDHSDTAKLNGKTVTSSGEVRDGHVQVKRSYTFEKDRIKCAVNLSESSYAGALSIWSHGRKWSQVRLAYEMIPYRYDFHRNKSHCTVTATLADGKSTPLTKEPTNTQKVRIDRGGYGVDVILPEARNVQLGNNGTILIEITKKEVPADQVKLSYELVPYAK